MDIEANKSSSGRDADWTSDIADAIAGATVGVATVPPTVKLVDDMPVGFLRKSGVSASAWSQRYGQRHRLVRIVDFPLGVTVPQRVRMYRRGDHYILQWWDPQARKNLSDRVNGDLVAALTRARQIEERLARHGSSGLAHRHISHAELVEAYLVDLRRRADAGYIRVSTVRRLGAALRHYLAFCDDLQSHFPCPSRVGREFALRLAGYLHETMISPNGHAHTALRRMKSRGYVMDTVRAMYAWASDVHRGNLLPPECSNTFHKNRDERSGDSGTGLLGEPDITVGMAADFLKACDLYQLPMFALLICYGLRAGEPCMLFHEHIEDGWLKVVCVEKLEYTTKGKRDKWLPLVPVIEKSLGIHGMSDHDAVGLLLRRRYAGKADSPLLGVPLEKLTTEYERRTMGISEAVGREEIRQTILRETGGLDYDAISREFRRIRSQLGWPDTATLKDFRHLFATCMQNSGMPERYIKYLLGHTQGREAIVHYAHLNQIRQHYEAALQSQMKPVIEALSTRLGILGL